MEGSNIRPVRWLGAVALATALACGGGTIFHDPGFFAFAYYEWVYADWLKTDLVHGTGHANFTQLGSGPHPPELEISFGVFPAVDNVAEEWFLARQTTVVFSPNPAFPVKGILLGYEHQRSLDGGGTLEVGVTLTQGGKTYLCDQRATPTATRVDAHWAALTASNFVEWDMATRATVPGSFPNLSNGAPVMAGWWVHARRADPSTMTESVLLDSLVVTLDQ